MINNLYDYQEEQKNYFVCQQFRAQSLFLALGALVRPGVIF